MLSLFFFLIKLWKCNTGYAHDHWDTWKLPNKDLPFILLFWHRSKTFLLDTRQESPHPGSTHGVVMAQVQNQHLALFSLMRFPWAHFSSLFRSPWIASWSLWVILSDFFSIWPQEKVSILSSSSGGNPIIPLTRTTKYNTGNSVSHSKSS